MNKHSEIMQALLDGKKLTRETWLPGPNDDEDTVQYIHLVNGVLCYSNGAYCRMLDGEYQVYVEPPPPNPWPKGTFQWAHEESHRGNTVRRRSAKHAHYDLTQLASVALGHALATDWEVVS
jgi:hypothetical protein